ncbi:hypothetical protein Tco_1407355, partial [Tanacetum coccineum]
STGQLDIQGVEPVVGLVRVAGPYSMDGPTGSRSPGYGCVGVSLDWCVRYNCAGELLGHMRIYIGVNRASGVISRRYSWAETMELLAVGTVFGLFPPVLDVS